MFIFWWSKIWEKFMLHISMNWFIHPYPFINSHSVGIHIYVLQQRINGNGEKELTLKAINICRVHYWRQKPKNFIDIIKFGWKSSTRFITEISIDSVATENNFVNSVMNVQWVLE